MGSFSWTRADKTTNRSNITTGDRYKIWIPQESTDPDLFEEVYPFCIAWNEEVPA